MIRKETSVTNTMVTVAAEEGIIPDKNNQHFIDPDLFVRDDGRLYLAHRYAIFLCSLSSWATK